jgi:concanavalin A-like lectin/glucanase superfamily protein
MTFEFVFRADAVPANGGFMSLLSKGRFVAASVSAEYNFHLQTAAGVTKVGVDWYNPLGAISFSLASTAVVIGTTYHVALVRSGTTFTLYLNGTQVDQKLGGPAGNVTTTFPISLGADLVNGDGNVGIDFANGTSQGPTGFGYSGRMAEVRIWKIARSAGNVALYKDRWLDSRDTDIQSSPGVYTGNLVGYWHLNEGSGVIINGTPTTPAYFSVANTAKRGSLMPLSPRWVAPILGPTPGVPLDSRIRGAVAINDPALLGPAAYDDILRVPNPTVAGFPHWAAFPAALTAAPAVWTVEIKVKFNTVTTPQRIFWYETYAGAGVPPSIFVGIGLETEGGASRVFGFSRDIAGLQVICGGGANATVAAGTTYSLALVRNGASLRLYVDGVRVGTDGALAANGPAAIPDQDPTQICIGASNSFAGDTVATTTYHEKGGAGPFTLTQNVQDRLFASSDIVVQELRVWNVDRSSVGATGINKILELVNQQLINVPGERTGLIGYFPMQDDTVDQGIDQPFGIRDDQVARAGFLAFPPTNRPHWTSGIILLTWLDGDGTTCDAMPEGVFGLANFRSQSDTFFLVKKQGTSFFKIAQPLNGTSETAWTKLRDNRSPANLEFFAAYENRLYSCDGSGLPLRYDGTNYFTAGIYPPPVEPVVFSTTAVGAALPNGDAADYVYTAYNDRLGIESNPSPPLRFVNASGGTVDVTLQLFVLSDPQVTRLRIYRTTSGAGSPASTKLFLIGEIANPVPSPAAGLFSSVIFTDHIPNASQNASIFVDPAALVNDPPPRAIRFPVAFRDRMFYCGNSDTPQTVYFSRKFFPDAVPVNNFLTFDDKDGAPVVGGAPLLDNLVILKTNSIWHAIEDANGVLTIKKMHEGTGCIAPGSIVPFDQGFMFFLSNRGPMVYDAERPLYIGYSIQDEFATWNKSRLPFATACYYRRRGQMLLSVTRSTTGTKNDTWYVCDLRSFVGDPTGQPYWVRYTTPPAWATHTIQANTMLQTIDATGQERVFFGDAFGFVNRFENANSDGSRVVLGSSGLGSLQLTGMIDQASVVATPTSLQALGAGMTPDALKGVRIRIATPVSGLADVRAQEVRVIRNTADTLFFDQTLLFESTGGPFTPAAGDVYRIAFIDYHVRTQEFVVQPNFNPTNIPHVRMVMSPFPGLTVKVQRRSDLETKLGEVIDLTIPSTDPSPYPRIRTAFARGRSSAIDMVCDTWFGTQDGFESFTIFGVILNVEPGEDH